MSENLVYFFLDLCEYFDKFPNKTLKHPLPQSLVHIINYDIQRKNATYMLIKSMLKYLKKNIKKSQCFSSNLRTKSMIKYSSYKNLRNLLRQLLSCKISYKIQLKNLKYLPPQSLTCEFYRKQGNEVKDLFPQSRLTRKFNDKMQQRVVKCLFSQSLLPEINDKMHQNQA